MTKIFIIQWQSWTVVGNFLAVELYGHFFAVTIGSPDGDIPILLEHRAVGEDAVEFHIRPGKNTAEGHHEKLLAGCGEFVRPKRLARFRCDLATHRFCSDLGRMDPQLLARDDNAAVCRRRKMRHAEKPGPRQIIRHFLFRIALALGDRHQ